jgi:hypothetical protein
VTRDPFLGSSGAETTLADVLLDTDAAVVLEFLGNFRSIWRAEAIDEWSACIGRGERPVGHTWKQLPHRWQQRRDAALALCTGVASLLASDVLDAIVGSAPRSRRDQTDRPAVGPASSRAASSSAFAIATALG